MLRRRITRLVVALVALVALVPCSAGSAAADGTHPSTPARVAGATPHVPAAHPTAHAAPAHAAPAVARPAPGTRHTTLDAAFAKLGAHAAHEPAPHVDAEPLETSVSKLKAARAELSAGAIDPARRAEIEKLVATVRAKVKALPATPENARAIAKADYAVQGVSEKLEGLDNGTFRPRLPDIAIRDALSPVHAPRVPTAQMRTAFARWMTELDLSDGHDQAIKVRPLFDALKGSGYAAPEAADLLAEVLAESIATRKLGSGGWQQHLVQDEIFRMFGFPEADPQPPLWGTVAPPARPLDNDARNAPRLARVKPQTAAIFHDLDRVAEVRERYVRPQVDQMARLKGVSPAAMNAARDLFRRAPVHIKFRLSDGLLAGLERDPTWKNVHETGTTGGNSDLTARRFAERRLGFDPYPKDPAATPPDSERPRYGYVNITNGTEGQATHYGDATLILKHDVKSRSTLCFGDSFGNGRLDPARPLTTFAHPDIVLGDIASSGKLDPLLAVAQGRKKSVTYPFPLNEAKYVEVQIFGEVDLKRDVEAIVLGPEAAASPQRDRMIALGKKLGIPVLVNPKDGVANIGFLP